MPYMPYIKVEITKTEWGRGAEQVNLINHSPRKRLYICFVF